MHIICVIHIHLCIYVCRHDNGTFGALLAVLCVLFLFAVLACCALLAVLCLLACGLACLLRCPVLPMHPSSIRICVHPYASICFFFVCVRDMLEENTQGETLMYINKSRSAATYWYRSHPTSQIVP